MLQKIITDRVRRPRKTKRQKYTHDLFCTCRKCVRSELGYIKQIGKKA